MFIIDNIGVKNDFIVFDTGLPTTLGSMISHRVYYMMFTKLSELYIMNNAK